MRIWRGNGVITDHTIMIRKIIGDPARDSLQLRTRFSKNNQLFHLTHHMNSLKGEKRKPIIYNSLLCCCLNEG